MPIGRPNGNAWPQDRQAAIFTATLSGMDDLALLRREFDAEEGSFLLQLRCDLQWDKEAFSAPAPG